MDKREKQVERAMLCMTRQCWEQGWQRRHW